MSDSPASQSHEALRHDLAELMLEIMHREPGSGPELSDETSCVGGDLLQDSLDVLEFAVALDRNYGVSIRDEEIGRVALSDLGNLTRYVAEHRVR